MPGRERRSTELFRRIINTRQCKRTVNRNFKFQRGRALNYRGVRWFVSGRPSRRPTTIIINASGPPPYPRLRRSGETGYTSRSARGHKGKHRADVTSRRRPGYAILAGGKFSRCFVSFSFSFLLSTSAAAPLSTIIDINLVRRGTAVHTQSLHSSRRPRPRSSSFHVVCYLLLYISSYYFFFFLTFTSSPTTAISVHRRLRIIKTGAHPCFYYGRAERRNAQERGSVDVRKIIHRITFLIR